MTALTRLPTRARWHKALCHPGDEGEPVMTILVPTRNNWVTADLNLCPSSNSSDAPSLVLLAFDGAVLAYVANIH